MIIKECISTVDMHSSFCIQLKTGIYIPAYTQPPKRAIFKTGIYIPAYTQPPKRAIITLNPHPGLDPGSHPLFASDCGSSPQ